MITLEITTFGGTQNRRSSHPTRGYQQVFTGLRYVTPVAQSDSRHQLWTEPSRARMDVVDDQSAAAWITAHHDKRSPGRSPPPAGRNHLVRHPHL